jgi:site-specific recombinase
MKQDLKMWVSGAIIGGIIIGIIVAFAVSIVWATVFIKYANNQALIADQVQSITKIK